MHNGRIHTIQFEAIRETLPPPPPGLPLSVPIKDKQKKFTVTNMYIISNKKILKKNVKLTDSPRDGTTR